MTGFERSLKRLLAFSSNSLSRVQLEDLHSSSPNSSSPSASRYDTGCPCGPFGIVIVRVCWLGGNEGRGSDLRRRRLLIDIGVRSRGSNSTSSSRNRCTVMMG